MQFMVHLQVCSDDQWWFSNGVGLFDVVKQKLDKAGGCKLCDLDDLQAGGVTNTHSVAQSA